MVDYLKRLGQRKMAQWALAYAAAAWVALQAIGLAAEGYGWPPLVMRVCIGLALLGFLATLILAWYHGERGQQKATGAELLILAAVLAVGGGVIWRSERQAAVPPIAAAPARATPPPAIAAKTDINPRSIAVLPFANLSADKDNAYFAEGIQDEILTRLSKVAELKVISRTSTLRYASKPENLSQIAKELGVANILEGSVQKVGNSVRINVQLIRAASDTHLWAEIYDRELVDVFSIQSEVTAAIAKQLQATLTADEQRDVAAKPTSNTAAYEAYLRGLAIEHQGVGQSVVAVYPGARDQFAEAVRLDPAFAPAWRHWLGVTSLLYFNDVDRTPAVLASMKQAAETVARLQPDSADAWLALGYYRYRGLRDFPAAAIAFGKAIERLPNDADALVALAFVERRQGKLDGALLHVARAEALDPGNPTLPAIRGEFLEAGRRHAEARAAFDRSQTLQPGKFTMIAAKIDSFQMEGDLASAQALLDALPASAPLDDMFYARLNQLYFTRRFDQILALCRNVVDGPLPVDVDALGRQLECRDAIAFVQTRRKQTAAAQATCQGLLGFIKDPAVQPLLGEEMRKSAALRLQRCLGDKSAALRIARKIEADLHGDTKQTPGAQLSIAFIHAESGDAAAAVPILRRLLSVPYGTTVGQLRFGPSWDPIRKDPEFQALLRTP